MDAARLPETAKTSMQGHGQLPCYSKPQSVLSQLYQSSQSILNGPQHATTVVKSLQYSLLKQQHTEAAAGG